MGVNEQYEELVALADTWEHVADSMTITDVEDLGAQRALTRCAEELRETLHGEDS